MVTIITGASHTGKTLLAQNMLDGYGYPYLCIDHLKMGLIRSGNTDLTPEDDGELTAYLWPIVREIIKTVIENNQNLVVEGCYIPFGWRNDFDENYLKEIRFICLCLSDSFIDANYDSIIAHSCVVERRLDGGFCAIKELKADNKAYFKGFTDAGEKVTVIENDYEQTLKGVLKAWEYGNT